MTNKDLIKILQEVDLPIDIEDSQGNTIITIDLKDYDLADIDDTIRLQAI